MSRLLRFALPLSLAISVGSSHASALAQQSIVSMSTGTITPHYFAVGAVSGFAGKTVSIYSSKGGASFGSPVVNTLSIGAQWVHGLW